MPELIDSVSGRSTHRRSTSSAGNNPTTQVHSGFLPNQPRDPRSQPRTYPCYSTNSHCHQHHHVRGWSVTKRDTRIIYVCRPYSVLPPFNSLNGAATHGCSGSPSRSLESCASLGTRSVLLLALSRQTLISFASLLLFVTRPAP